MKKIELLAPAKNTECGMAAIKCGADAVYIGASNFGARSAAGNSVDDIKKLVDFAHFYSAQVYVTINTILTDTEIKKATELIYRLYEINVDAIIIQDMGLLECDLPPIPIHASTQVHNTTIEKIRFLENVGFQRVILARELSLPQIKEINEHTNVELEAFVHGALCVSYSGQCYLSYAIGGRSGNRGECAQPCRKKYSLKTEDGKFLVKDKHLLSLKDLNLSGRVSDMIEAGITSFKIEGRLKDINYIKNIVSYYDREINKVIENKPYLKRASDGRTIINFTPNTHKTFNRGYCEYFINGRTKNITSFDTPKSIGEPIGKVIEIKNKAVKVSCKGKKLNNGDGICFFDESGKLLGTTINNVNAEWIYPNDIKLIKKDFFIYRNFDQEFQKLLKNTAIERKVSIKVNIYQDDNTIVFNAIDENNNKAIRKLNNNFELAQNTETAINNIKKQISKLGQTNFICERVDINLSDIPFIPIKTLNEERRLLIEELVAKRLENYEKQTAGLEKNEFPYPEKSVNFNANILNSHAETFYKRHGVESIDKAAESGLDLTNQVVMTTKHCLRYQFDLCLKSKNYKNEKAENDLYLVDEKNREYKLIFDCKNCEMQILLI